MIRPTEVTSFRQGVAFGRGVSFAMQEVAVIEAWHELAKVLKQAELSDLRDIEESDVIKWARLELEKQENTLAELRKKYGLDS